MSGPIIARGTTFDPDCLTLAEHFLDDDPGEYTDAEYHDLAATIQIAIEEWLVERATEVTKPVIDPRDPDPTREGIFRDHNCYRCQSGAKPCIKGKGNERNCDTLHARND